MSQARSRKKRQTGKACFGPQWLVRFGLTPLLGCGDKDVSGGCAYELSDQPARRTAAAAQSATGPGLCRPGGRARPGGQPSAGKLCGTAPGRVLRTEHPPRHGWRGSRPARLFAGRRAAGPGLPLDRAVLQYARVDCGAAVREPGRLVGNQRLSRRSGGETTQIDRREFFRAQQFRPAGHL